MTVKPALVSDFLFINYPDEDSDPFWDQFVSMVQGFESAIFMRKVFENSVIGGGGNRVWDGATGLFTWSANFTLTVPHWGYKATIVNGSDNATKSQNLQDGQFMYLQLPQGMATNITLNFKAASQLNQHRHDELVVATRIGTKLYLRNFGEMS